jgi:hypothetical protein
MADNKPPVSVFAIGINAVWLEARNGLDVFRRLRREIPILYVGSDKTVLVKHPYNHFFDLSKPWAVDTDTHPHEVTLQQFATPFADGTIVMPTLKTNFVNLSLS